MKSRVNPRTGTVNNSVKKVAVKIQQITPSSPTVSAPILSQKNIDDLLNALKDLKESVVTELRTARVISAQASISQLALDPHREMEIIIDESISDVGIGEVEELKKGEEAVTIGKDETQEDQSLSQSKKRLQALKRRPD